MNQPYQNQVDDLQFEMGQRSANPSNRNPGGNMYPSHRDYSSNL